jgi:hypothetical protein
MRDIRHWLAGAALLAGTAVAMAQPPTRLPGPVAEPPIAAALPGGTVVGSMRNSTPVASVNIMAVEEPPPAPPAAGAPIVPAPGPIVPGPVPPPGCAPGCPAPPLNGNCCGPVGAHGPIGQEVYLRVGATIPLGQDSALARNINVGWAVQVGGRSQFFDPAGDAAWAVDVHLHYTYNNAGGRDIVTFAGEPVIIRDLHRTAVGVGFGRDMFLSAPGFVAGTFDANFRLGWDVGGRWGTGHVNLTPLLEPDGYRRHHDVFGQTFAGVMGTMEMPIGAYTALGGIRVEWDYTFSDILPKGGSFHEINTFLIMGVRY